ncbi:MAG TPA: LmeA family phospholipid-binding protein, partial [Actinomycetes bacterium]|nr:LmeA family phospholipid-binding protein [Actinomycetes bacterium]
GGQVTLEASGVRVRVSADVLGRRLEAVVAGQLAARNGRLAFQPRSVEVGGERNPVLESTLISRFTFDVPLPRLPADIRVERVNTEPGSVVLAGRAGPIEVAA